MDGLSKNSLCSGMNLSKNDLHPMGKILNQDAFILSFAFSCTKIKQESKSRLRTKRFASAQKTTRMMLSKKMR